jgi:hypothetical protein
LVNIHEPRQIEPVPRDADQVRWRVPIDDGTIPASVDVYVTGTDAARVPDDLTGWIRDELERRVPDSLDDPAKVAILRELSPVQLHPPLN